MRFAFGHHELDAERFELRREGELVAIQPKVLELIIHLIRNRDRAVGPDELFRAVWPETAVTKSSLARAVSLARRAIGDAGRSPISIVTVPRRGYRVEAEVAIVADSIVADVPSLRYVGRTHILARAHAALDAALAGHGRILLLVGEAGIGKTRTAELLCERGRAARAEVAAIWGLASDAPTYWSWTCILRQLDQADPRALESMPRTQRSALASLLPDDRSANGALPSTSSDAARFVLFDAVQAFVARVARTRPLVIMLDDLHAADAESIALMEFIGRSLASLPIAIVTTARESDVALAPQQLRAQERLLRLGCLERWSLTGLHDEELREFVERKLGREPASELLSALERQTGGNPLLLTESLRSLETRELLGEIRTRSEWESLLPRGIEHLLRPKLRPLSTAAIETLALASAIGVEIDRRLLDACTQAPSGLALQLEELHSIGLLAAGASPSRLRFSHGLVREAIYEELVPAGGARRALHARIFAALDTASMDLAVASGASFGEAARHACEAVPLVDPLRAAELSCRAAEQAARLHDFEGAAARFERALAVLPSPSLRDRALHATLWLGLANARARSLGLERARVSFLAAADAARACGRAYLLAQAALGLAQRPNSTGQDDPEVAALLDEALHGLPRNSEALQIRVSSRLAAELRYSERARSLELADEALAAARRLGDPIVLAETLEDRTFMLWSPSNPEAWIALNAEVAQSARAANDLDLAISGHKGCVSGALEIGDYARVEREVRACERIAREVPTPYARWWCAVLQAARALIEGELDTAEGLILESLRIAERVDSPEVAIELQAQLVYLRTEQGRTDEIEPAVREQVRRFPKQPTWRAAFARILVASGQLAEARLVIGPLIARQFEDIPIDRGWLATHALAAEVVAAIGDAQAAEQLEARLLPFVGRTIVLGSALYYGPAEYFLGLLAATRSRFDEAVSHFETAITNGQRAGARIFVARTRLACARALLARGEAGDRARAARLVRAVLDGVEGRPFRAVADEAREVCAALWRRVPERSPARRRRGRSGKIIER